MHIKKLKLHNFRCYENLEIEFEPGLNVVVGENGRGKTAIFDGITIGLAEYLDAFGFKGKGIEARDVRRAPVYNDAKQLVAMENHLPTEVELIVDNVDGTYHYPDARQRQTLHLHHPEIHRAARHAEDPERQPL